jgi:hypothetical protein
LANIKGLKAVQSLFDDDHLERDMPEKATPEKKRETGSILKPIFQPILWKRKRKSLSLNWI